MDNVSLVNGIPNPLTKKDKGLRDHHIHHDNSLEPQNKRVKIMSGFSDPNDHGGKEMATLMQPPDSGILGSIGSNIMDLIPGGQDYEAFFSDFKDDLDAVLGSPKPFSRLHSVGREVSSIIPQIINSMNNNNQQFQYTGFGLGMPPQNDHNKKSNFETISNLHQKLKTLRNNEQISERDKMEIKKELHQMAMQNETGSLSSYNAVSDANSNLMNEDKYKHHRKGHGEETKEQENVKHRTINTPQDPATTSALTTDVQTLKNQTESTPAEIPGAAPIVAKPNDVQAQPEEKKEEKKEETKTMSLDSYFDLKMTQHDRENARKLADQRAGNQNFKRGTNEQKYDPADPMDKFLRQLDPTGISSGGGEALGAARLGLIYMTGGVSYAIQTAANFIDYGLHFDAYEKAKLHKNDDLLYDLAPWIHPITGITVAHTPEYINQRAEFYNQLAKETHDFKSDWGIEDGYSSWDRWTKTEQDRFVQEAKDRNLYRVFNDPSKWDIEGSAGEYTSESLKYFQDQNKYVSEQMRQRQLKNLPGTDSAYNIVGNPELDPRRQYHPSEAKAAEIQRQQDKNRNQYLADQKAQEEATAIFEAQRAADAAVRAAETRDNNIKQQEANRVFEAHRLENEAHKAEEDAKAAAARLEEQKKRQEAEAAIKARAGFAASQRRR